MGTNQRSVIQMSDAEVTAFIDGARTATMATVGPSGAPHLVAMWFAVIDGQIWFETKAKAQKVKNLQRNDQLTVMIEDGLTYDSLRGVSLDGRGVIVDDPDQLWKIGVNVWERYNGEYTDEVKPFVEAMLHKRVAVRLDVDRVRSWDHTKLGMGAVPIGGSTAPADPAADAQALVDRYWEAHFERNWDAMAGFFSPTCHYTDVGIDPTGSTGPDEIIKRLRLGIEPLSAYEHFPRTSVAACPTLPDGGGNKVTVVTEHMERWSFHTGEVIDHPFTSVMDVADGKIQRWHDYSHLGNLLDNAPAWWIEHIANGWR